MKTRHLTGLLLLPALLCGFAALWRLQWRIDATRAPLQAEEDELLISSGKLIKGASLEYAPLAGEFYWTRAVQYYGNKYSRPEQSLTQLWPLLDISTTLDTHLLIAYRFGAVFLAEPRTRGAGRPDLAVELIQKGIRENPEYWAFYQDLGNVYYFNAKDYPKAAAAFLEGSKNPAAPIWMKVLAAKILEQGESRETSKFLWADVYQNTKDPVIKKNAMTHLELIRAEEDCEQLNAVLVEYQTRTGHRAGSLRELVDTGFLLAIPVDPRGFAYSLDENGKADLNPASSLSKDRPIFQKPM